MLPILMVCARAHLAVRHEDDDNEEAEQRRYHRELDAMRTLAVVQGPHEARCGRNGASSNTSSISTSRRGSRISHGDRRAGEPQG